MNSFDNEKCKIDSNEWKCTHKIIINRLDIIGLAPFLHQFHQFRFVFEYLNR